MGFVLSISVLSCEGVSMGFPFFTLFYKYVKKITTTYRVWSTVELKEIRLHVSVKDVSTCTDLYKEFNAENNLPY